MPESVSNASAVHIPLTFEGDRCRAVNRSESFGRRCLAWAQSQLCCFSGRNTDDQAIPVSRRNVSVLTEVGAARKHLPESDRQSPDGGTRLTLLPSVEWGKMLPFDSNNNVAGNDDEAGLRSLFGLTKSEKIYFGSFGTVYKYCKYSDEGPRDYAVKIHHVSEEDGQALACHGGDKSCYNDFMNQRGEQVGLKYSYYPGIVTVHALVMQSITGSGYMPVKSLDDLKPEDYKKFQLKMVISEYVDGSDLYHLMTEYKKLTNIPGGGLSLAKKLALQLSAVFEFLHAEKVIYRDIKPENVMVQLSEAKEPVFKLIDFGGSKQLDKRNRTGSICGSPISMAPEMVEIEEVMASEVAGKDALADPSYTYSADCWSFGILIWEVLAAGSGIRLWDKINKKFGGMPDSRQAQDLSQEPQKLEKISLGPILKKMSPDDISQTFDDTVSHTERGSPDAVLLKKMVLGLLKADPDKRMTMKDVRELLILPPVYN